MSDLCQEKRKGIITVSLLVLILSGVGIVIYGGFRGVYGGECCPENRVCGDECCKGNDACFDGECKDVCEEGNFECGIIDLGDWGTFNCGACRACEECNIVYLCKDKCTTPKKCIGDGFDAECEECEDECKNWEYKECAVIVLYSDNPFGMGVVPKYYAICAYGGEKRCKYSDGNYEGSMEPIVHSKKKYLGEDVSDDSLGPSTSYCNSICSSVSKPSGCP